MKYDSTFGSYLPIGKKELERCEREREYKKERTTKERENSVGRKRKSEIKGLGQDKRLSTGSVGPPSIHFIMEQAD